MQEIFVNILLGTNVDFEWDWIYKANLQISAKNYICSILHNVKIGNNEVACENMKLAVSFNFYGQVYNILQNTS